MKNVKRFLSWLTMLMLLIAGVSRADVQTLDQFRLPLLTLVNKYRFVFSDLAFENQLDQAAIKFDLEITPQHTLANTTYELFIIETCEETGNNLEDLLQQPTALPGQKGIKNTKKTLQYAEDIEQVLQPLVQNFTVYNTLLMNGAQSDSPVSFKQSYRIDNEGIYNTYFLLARRQEFITIEEPTLVDEFDESISDILDGNFRNLRAASQMNWNVEHVKMTGQVAFENTYGYLQADEYPLLRFYLYCFVTYLFVTLAWWRTMSANENNKISIHFYITVLLTTTTIECAMLFLDYDMFNESGKRNLTFTVFNIFFVSFRNTLARLIALLISLGYGIVTNMIGRYASKIGLLSFLFFVSCAFSNTFFYLNQQKPLSTSVRMASLVPQCCFDVIFVIWITSALLRTMAYLQSKRQEYKYGIMKSFAIWICLCFFLLTIYSFIFIFIHMFVDATWVWHFAYMFEIAWFSTFSICFFAIVYIFRPTDESTYLAEVDELLDETLTEIDGGRAGGSQLSHRNVVNFEEVEMEEGELRKGQKDENEEGGSSDI